MVNSAVYLTDGEKVRGVLDERDDHALVFRSEDGRELLRTPYAAVDRVKLVLPSRSRMTFVIGADEHRIKLTGDIVEDVRISKDSTLPSGYERSDATREEKAADEIGTVFLALTNVATFVAADRVRRRRIRKRVTERIAEVRPG
jgi:hypothetical protein